RPRGARRAAPLARSVLGRRPALAQERRRSARPSVEEKAVNRTIQIAPVRRTIVVDATPERTFAVFTAGIDRWWPRGHGIGAAPLVKSVIEPFVGGRWYTTHEDGVEVTVGHVRAWEPPGRFVVGWEITPDWKPEPRIDLSSEVEVRFLPEAGGRTAPAPAHRDLPPPRAPPRPSHP